MANLQYNEIRERKYIVLDGHPYEVVGSHIFRKQQRKPVNQTKLKSMLTGKMTERSFGSSETAEEADISSKKVKYLFHKLNRQTEVDEYWFCNPNDPKDRFFLSAELLGNKIKFMKENSEVEAVVFEDMIIDTKIPIKVDLKVVEAPPAVKGSTVTGANKLVVLETGASINTPIFVNEGDVIRINTETGDYVERV